MNNLTCSCCNRSFQSSQLRHHGVAGGVRPENELLCADCWKVFSTDSWDDSATPQGKHEEHSTRKRKVQDPGNTSEAAQNKIQSVMQSPEEQGDPLDQLRRLSGAGVFDSGSAFACALVQRHADLPTAGSAANSNQNAAEDKASAGGQVVAEPLKRAGSALARDRSGRFVGKSKPAASIEDRGARPGAPSRWGTMDPEDPLEQDLMASQAHLFDDAPMHGPAESLNPQVSQNTAKQEGTASGEVLSPAARMHASSQQAARVRSTLSDTDCLSELKQLWTKVASLEQSLLAARLQTLCIMCKAAARNTVTRPCGHVLYCAPCMAARVAASGICPECTSPIAETQAVILVSP